MKNVLLFLCLLVCAPAVAQAKPPLPLRVIGKIGKFYGRSFKDEYGFHDKFYSSAILVSDAASVTDIVIQFKIQKVCPDCYEGGPLFHNQSLYVSNMGWAAIEQLGLLPLSSWLHRRAERGHTRGDMVLYGLSAGPIAFTAGQRISDAVATWPFYQRVKIECGQDPLSCQKPKITIR